MSTHTNLSGLSERRAEECVRSGLNRLPVSLDNEILRQRAIRCYVSQLRALDLAAAGWSLVYADRLVVHHYPSAYRDAARRRSLLLRNALWTAWLRRPLRVALRETLYTLVKAR